MDAENVGADEEYDVPQGMPVGLRLGGDDERKLADCDVCKGNRSYEIIVFGPPDDSGERQPVKQQQVCPACDGQGKTWVI